MVFELEQNVQKKLALFCAGRMSHAVLLTGGSVKTRAQAARYLAAATVCAARDDTRPCGHCEACRKAENTAHPDIKVFQKPENKRYFVKDDVKELRLDVYRTPNEAEVKAYILTELQNMNEECQNLLLNILEEPPAYAAFILTASSKNVLLGTVLSRVVKLSLDSDVGPDASKKAVKTASEIAKALLSSDEYDVFRAAAPLEGNKELFEETLRELLLMLRDAFAAGTKAMSACGAQAASLSATLSRAQLLTMYDITAELLDGFDRNRNQTIMLAVLCAKLRRTAQL